MVLIERTLRPLRYCELDDMPNPKMERPVSDSDEERMETLRNFPVRVESRVKIFKKKISRIRTPRSDKGQHKRNKVRDEFLTDKEEIPDQFLRQELQEAFTTMIQESLRTGLLKGAISLRSLIVYEEDTTKRIGVPMKTSPPTNERELRKGVRGILFDNKGMPENKIQDLISVSLRFNLIQF
ncbi:hypothetical protein CEXT_498371 [Caerostris extrusa]|uniref:Uncharacterized protein n=1 Tax=Caerostris extrusa TaxID=172846 RepID=A0AAV4M4H4_CAEEX|nr:hypothetical protein CEXT_498371 [Caerostris extrusa]